MVPEAAIDLLVTMGFEPNKYTPTHGGFSHQSTIATINQEQRCVIKAANSDAKRASLSHEAQMLDLLRSSQLPVPSLIALLEDDDWTIELIEFLPGTNGLTILAEEPHVVPNLYLQLGRALKQLHSVTVSPMSPDKTMAKRTAELRDTLSTLPLPASLLEALLDSLAHEVWALPNRQLVHGDPGLHNVLWQEPQLALIDWEWAGWGDPRQDLAWIWWTMQWRKMPQAYWESFLEGYMPEQPELLSAQSLQTIALGQIAFVLTQAYGNEADWLEWQARAEWTLHLLDQ